MESTLRFGMRHALISGVKTRLQGGVAIPQGTTPPEQQRRKYEEALIAVRSFAGNVVGQSVKVAGKSSAKAVIFTPKDTAKAAIKVENLLFDHDGNENATLFKGDEVMRIHKLYIVLGMLLAFGVFFELAAHADEANEATTITFSAPIQIPGRMLPAGTYHFQRANSDNPNLVQIFNADRNVLYATLETIPADRTEATGHTTIALAQPTTGNPVLVKWFYPGSLTGHEFAYPKAQEQNIAQAKQEVFLGNGSMASAEAAGE
jgi:hypothetical protein